MSFSRYAVCQLLTLVFLALGATGANAHVYRGMGTQAKVTSETAAIRLQMAVVDSVLLAPSIDTNRDGRLSRAEYTAGQRDLAAAHGEAVKVSSGGIPVQATNTHVEVESTEGLTDEPHALVFNLEYQAPAAGWQELRIDPNVFRGLTVSPITGKAIVGAQRNTITVDDRGRKATLQSTGRESYDSGAHSAVASTTGTSGTDTAAAAAVTAETGASESGQSTAQLAGYFFKEGIIHILTGWDHVLFVLALLLMANNLISLIKVVTAFTIAHSITLVVVSMGLINISEPKYLEAAVAATLAYIGFDNLMRVNKEVRFRWIMVFAFGLLHGMAFAENLKALFGEGGTAYTSSQVVSCLLTFNIGVEVGQLMLIAVGYPILYALRKYQPQVARGAVVAGSALVLFCGASLVADRTFAPKKLPWVEWIS